MDKDAIVLVIGATGQQGGATARHLLAGGRGVRALVRDPQKPAAQWLVQAGAELVQGDLDDRASLDRAMQGVYGVFSIQTPFAKDGPVGETRQGRAVANAAKAAGVQHFVYTSVGGAERNTGIPHFESKWLVEQYIRDLDLPATILRPAFFMENFSQALAPQEREGTLVLTVAQRPDRPMQMIAADDIGFFAARAFARPEETIGTATELAGDSLTMPQVAEMMSKVRGRPVQFYPLPVDQLRSFNEDAGLMFEWFNESGYAADIPTLRAIHPELMTFETWMRRKNER